MAKGNGQLTEPQQKILSFITNYVDQNNVPPTIREIQAGTGISSTSMVSYHLKALERASMLNRYERRSRGLVINEPNRVHPSEVAAVPIVGVIGASAPAPTPDADALASAENSVQIARSMVGTGEGLYAAGSEGELHDRRIN